MIRARIVAGSWGISHLKSKDGFPNLVGDKHLYLDVDLVSSSTYLSVNFQLEIYTYGFPRFLTSQG